MERKLIITPERARGFLIAVMREWDSQGLLIRSVKVKRDAGDAVQNILLTYEDRREEDDSRGENEETEGRDAHG